MAYYPYPDTLDPLPAHLQAGLIVIATCGLLSFASATGAILFIVYRVSNKKRYQAAPLRSNQPLILILNLLIADLQQATSFVISLHWLDKNAILAPTYPCAAQGWLIQMGDVSSGIFSLAIAVQTFYVLVLRRSLPYMAFVWLILGIWAFCVLLSLISPILHWNEVLFVSAGAWCWISENYQDERLFIHYLWIFTCELGTIILYAIIFIVLRRKIALNTAAGVHARTVQRVARLMLVYPIAYTCLTLPLAAYRMSSQAGKKKSRKFLLFAGACMASCGWVDVILYLVTRSTIVTLHQQSLGEAHRPGAGGVGRIQMKPGLAYGNNTTIGGGAAYSMERSGVQGNASIASSQEGFVKLEQVVQVSVEQATPCEQAAAEAVQSQGGGNPTYW